MVQCSYHEFPKVEDQLEPLFTDLVMNMFSRGKVAGLCRLAEDTQSDAGHSAESQHSRRVTRHYIGVALRSLLRSVGTEPARIQFSSIAITCLGRPENERLLGYVAMLPRETVLGKVLPIACHSAKQLGLSAQDSEAVLRLLIFVGRIVDEESASPQAAQVRLLEQSRELVTALYRLLPALAGSSNNIAKVCERLLAVTCKGWSGFRLYDRLSNLHGTRDSRSTTRFSRFLLEPESHHMVFFVDGPLLTALRDAEDAQSPLSDL